MLEADCLEAILLTFDALLLQGLGGSFELASEQFDPVLVLDSVGLHLLTVKIIIVITRP